MGIHFALLGGDARQLYLAEALRQAGHTVSTYAVPDMENTGNVSRAEVVLLPTPALDAEGRVRGTTLTAREAADLCPAGATVIGGKVRELKNIFPGITDCAAWETLAIANAVPTAEGALHLAMEAMPGTIQGSRFLVIGAGRIGLCLARKLKALDGIVTVTARKARDLALLQAMALDTAVTGRYECGLGGFDCVFNTVPASVLTEAQLRELPKGCPVIELASAPGGFPREACENAGLRYISGAALPGRMTPKAAGELLAREVLRHLEAKL